MTDTPTRTPIPPTPTVPPEWTEAAPGLEVRAMAIPLPDAEPAEAILTRIDPARYDVRVHYDPTNPVTVGEWRARLGALAVINGGFFQEDHTTAGLIINEGQAAGVSFDQIEARYYEFGGMLAISGAGVDVRYLASEPYIPGEALTYAVQGLPMLVDGGAPIPFDLPDREARRTAVALDAAGRLVFITVSNEVISLYELRDWLIAAPELGIVAALNLDGGPSTGLAVNAGAVNAVYDSWSPVPSVVAIYPR